MSIALRRKSHKVIPTRLALDIIKSIVAQKGPISSKQLWALSQKVQPTPEEVAQDRLGSERASEISKFTTPGWVPPSKPPEKEKAPPGLSRPALKKHRNEQAALAKMKKLDNGHPIKSISCVQFWMISTACL
jgi:hypothetical protein